MEVLSCMFVPLLPPWPHCLMHSDAYPLLTDSKANSSCSQLMAQSPFASPGSFSAHPPSLYALHALPQGRCCFCVVSGSEACPKKTAHRLRAGMHGHRPTLPQTCIGQSEAQPAILPFHGLG